MSQAQSFAAMKRERDGYSREVSKLQEQLADLRQQVERLGRERDAQFSLVAEVEVKRLKAETRAQAAEAEQGELLAKLEGATHETPNG